MPKLHADRTQGEKLVCRRPRWLAAHQQEMRIMMTRLIPLTAVAGVLACFVAAGTAQAAPASGNFLGKFTAANQASVAVENVHWRRYHWWRHHHRRHHWW
jgi:hypothetical protein